MLGSVGLKFAFLFAGFTKLLKDCLRLERSLCSNVYQLEYLDTFFLLIRGRYLSTRRYIKKHLVNLIYY